MKQQAVMENEHNEFKETSCVKQAPEHRCLNMQERKQKYTSHDQLCGKPICLIYLNKLTSFVQKFQMWCISTKAISNFENK
jgi:hypothetical protein